MVAQVAMQMGKAAGRDPRPFSYFDFGQLAMVARGVGLLDSHGFRLGGPLGWLLWLVVHLFYLPGLRNRLAALTSWASNLVAGGPRLSRPMSQQAASPRLFSSGGPILPAQ